jgi:hypothetical protein
MEYGVFTNQPSLLTKFEYLLSFIQLDDSLSLHVRLFYNLLILLYSTCAIGMVC